jgi:cyanate permease
MFFPSQLELYTKSRRHFESSRNSKTTMFSSIVKILKDNILVLKNKTVLCLSLGLFNFCLGTYLVFMHLPKYVVEKGFPRSFAANLVSLSGILTALGRILTGVLHLTNM